MFTSHLLTPATSFLGRTEELSSIATLLGDPNCRLLTLVGPGGIGKTRLAIEAVKRIGDDFAHGVYVVDLQPVAAIDQVAPTIAAQLHAPSSGQSNSQALLLRRRLVRATAKLSCSISWLIKNCCWCWTTLSTSWLELACSRTCSQLRRV